PELDERFSGAAHFAKAFAGDPKIRLGPPAPFSRWLTEFGRDKSLPLQTAQCDVNASDCNLATAALFDRFADRHTIGLVVQSDQCQQHQQLEASQKLSRHFLNNTE